MSEFDYYCSLRPPQAGVPLSSKDARDVQAFAPAVFAAMKSRGYRVHLVTYAWTRPADPFYPVSRGGLPGGYGLRDFFGTPSLTTVVAMNTTPSAAVDGNPRGAGRAGYGLRNFLGLGGGGARAPRPRPGTRTAVVWETRRGEFFLVDHYYATPMWVDGANWLDKVRFYDPAAESVENVES